MARLIDRPIDMLDLQVDLVRWWRTSPNAQPFSAAFQDLMNAALHRKDIPLKTYLLSRLDVAEAIFVRRNITSELWQFAREYEAFEHEQITEDDLPVDKGFVYLDRIVYLTDGKGDRLSVRGILWTVETNGVVLVLMSDPNDPEDDINQKLAETYGKEEAKTWSDAPLSPCHVSSWQWNQKVRHLAEDDFNNVPLVSGDDERPFTHMTAAVESMNRMNTFIIVLWEFMQDQLPPKMRADRPMLRRLARAHSPLSEVSVIELRPPENNTPRSENPQVVFWTHRWRVREHKRRWIDKNGEYRETTIHAYIKGPEHLPYIEKDRVFDVKQ